MIRTQTCHNHHLATVTVIKPVLSLARKHMGSNMGHILAE